MKTFSISDIGKRREMNQDYMYTSENAVGNLPNLFIVADGMGGHKAGEYASRYTVETIVESIEKDERTEPVEVIEHAICKANEELIKKAAGDEAMSGMGTTVVVVTVIGKKAWVANVGDSRMYVVGKEIKQVTRDHSLVEEMVRMGEIAKDAAKDHPDKNIITSRSSRQSSCGFFSGQFRTAGLHIDLYGRIDKHGRGSGHPKHHQQSERRCGVRGEISPDSK